MNDKAEFTRFASGDAAYCYDKSLIVFLRGKRMVLSTSVYNGGLREDLSAVYNHDMSSDAPKGYTLLAPTYEGHLRVMSERLGLDPGRATGMGTVAHMEHAAAETLSYESLTVTAVATGGIETNGGRAGDPASYFGDAEKKPHGTINIILEINADMAPGTLTRALVTCTEAKTAALQELMADSRYSCGLATGSGTDQTILIANAESPLFLEDAGKHSKLGELIGRTVIAAVKRAMRNQSGLTPERQRDLLRRIRRFGVNADTIWHECKELNAADREKFDRVLAEVSASPSMLTHGAMYVHLFDEYKWGLLQPEETREAAINLLKLMAGAAGAEPPEPLQSADDCMEALGQLLAAVTIAKIRRD